MENRRYRRANWIGLMHGWMPDREPRKGKYFPAIVVDTHVLIIALDLVNRTAKGVRQPAGAAEDTQRPQ